MSDNIAERVRIYIVSNFIVADAASLADTDSLIEHQVIDSTGFLELVLFVEETFGFRIEDDEMIPENLESIANIEKFVRGKLAAVAAA